MPTARKTLDHGAALRVPPAHNIKAWTSLMGWLGDAGQLIDPGLVEVATPSGAHIAAPGDWIVLSASGSYHVTTPR
jgi:hypothetical protein